MPTCGANGVHGAYVATRMALGATMSGLRDAGVPGERVQPCVCVSSPCAFCCLSPCVSSLLASLPAQCLLLPTTLGPVCVQASDACPLVCSWPCLGRLNTHTHTHTYTSWCNSHTSACLARPPWSYRRQCRQLVEMCDAHGIAVVAYASLGCGELVGHPTVVAAAEKLGWQPDQVCGGVWQ